METVANSTPSIPANATPGALQATVGNTISTATDTANTTVTTVTTTADSALAVVTGGGDPPGPQPPAVGDITSATGALAPIVTAIKNTVDNTLPPPPGGTGQGLPLVVEPIKQIVGGVLAPVINPVAQTVGAIVGGVVAPVINPVTQIVGPILSPVAPIIRPVVASIVASLVPGSPSTTSTGSVSGTQPAASTPSRTSAGQPVTYPPSNPLADAAAPQTPIGSVQPGANPSTSPVAHGVGFRAASGSGPSGSGPTFDLATSTPATSFASVATASSLGASLTASHDRSVAGVSTAGGRLPFPMAPGGLAAAGGPSGNGGFSPIFFLALLVAFAALARLLSERVRLPSITWRPTVFIAIQERPG